MCDKTQAAYPEDEVEEEEHVLDTFGAAFDSHDGRQTDGSGAQSGGQQAWKRSV